MRQSLALLLAPVVSPRAGFRRFLEAHRQIDPVSLPLFSLLLFYFAALLAYAQVLRWTGLASGAAGLPAAAAGALTAALPFFGSLWLLAALLAWGLVLWCAGMLFGRRHPYGHWVGLAAVCCVPEVLRVLVDAAATLGGAGGLAAALPVDPFGLWEAVLVAFGFAAYTDRPLWAGAAVAAALAALQWGLRLLG